MTKIDGQNKREKDSGFLFDIFGVHVWLPVFSNLFKHRSKKTCGAGFEPTLSYTGYRLSRQKICLKVGKQKKILEVFSKYE